MQLVTGKVTSESYACDRVEAALVSVTPSLQVILSPNFKFSGKFFQASFLPCLVSLGVGVSHSHCPEETCCRSSMDSPPIRGLARGGNPLPAKPRRSVGYSAGHSIGPSSWTAKLTREGQIHSWRQGASPPRRGGSPVPVHMRPAWNERIPVWERRIPQYQDMSYQPMMSESQLGFGRAQTAFDPYSSQISMASSAARSQITTRDWSLLFSPGRSETLIRRPWPGKTALWHPSSLLHTQVPLHRTSEPDVRNRAPLRIPLSEYEPESSAAVGRRWAGTNLGRLYEHVLPSGSPPVSRSSSRMGL